MGRTRQSSRGRKADVPKKGFWGVSPDKILKKLVFDLFKLMHILCIGPRTTVMIDYAIKCYFSHNFISVRVDLQFSHCVLKFKHNKCKDNNRGHRSLSDDLYQIDEQSNYNNFCAIWEPHGTCAVPVSNKVNSMTRVVWLEANLPRTNAVSSVL